MLDANRFVLYNSHIAVSDAQTPDSKDELAIGCILCLKAAFAGIPKEIEENPAWQRF